MKPSSSVAGCGKRKDTSSSLAVVMAKARPVSKRAGGDGKGTNTSSKRAVGDDKGKVESSSSWSVGGDGKGFGLWLVLCM